MKSPLVVDLLAELPQPPQPPQKHIPDDELLLDVLCINCYDMIQIDRIERHSVICTTVSQKVMNLETASELTQITYKLCKIDRSLKMLGQEVNLSVGDASYIDILINLMAPIKDASEVVAGLSETVAQAAQSLSSMLVTFRGSNSILIYGERIRSLLNQLSSELSNNSLEDKQAEIDQLKNQIDMEKRKFSALQKSLGIDEVASDVSSMQSRSAVSSISSSPDDQQLDLGAEENPFGEVPLEADIQKEFYSQFLIAKMGLSSRDPAQYVQASTLFDKAVRTGVPAVKWPEFIRQEIEQARMTMRRSAKPLELAKNRVRKFDQMPVITEEEIG